MLETAAVDAYAQALALTDQMLDAARKSDWERLVQLEIIRGRILDELREANQGPPTSHQAGLERRDLIEAILERDRQIKLLTQDWMHELRDILGSATAQRLLNKTYDTP